MARRVGHAHAADTPAAGERPAQPPCVVLQADRALKRAATPFGAVAGLLVTSLLLGAIAAGNSFLGLDLLSGALVGAATARRFIARPVPRVLTVVAVTAVTFLAALGAIALGVSSNWR